MNLGWLAVVGVILLVAGLCTLAYDGLRRRQGKNPFPYPEIATNRLEDTAIRQLQRPAPVASNPKAIGHRLYALRNRLPSTVNRLFQRTPAVQVSTPGSSDFLTRFLLAIPRRAVVLIVVTSLALIGMSLAVLVVGADAPKARPGVVVLGISPFGAGQAALQVQANLVDYISKSAASTDGANIDIRLTATVPHSEDQAQAERARLGADFLLWGEPGGDGTFTATITLAPRFAIGRQPWQELADPDVSVMLLPPSSSLVFPSWAGTDPLVPLVLALANYRLGNYKAAVDTAWGAQETLNDSGARGQYARLVEAQSRLAQGDYQGTVTAVAQIETLSALPVDARLTRAAARSYLHDYDGAMSDCNQIIGDRNASDRELSAAYLLRARLRYSAGLLTQALADLGDSARLDPSNPRILLDTAEVYYRQAKPTEAANELETLLKGRPDAASAYRLMGLVRLMLGQPEESLKVLDRADGIYTNWIGSLRAQEGQANALGDHALSAAATNGIVQLNREQAGIALYEGMALGDIARKEPNESFLGGLWRGIRGEPTTWERALARMKDAARLDPRRPDIPLQMGSLYAQQGDYQNAAAMLQQSRDLDPSAPEPYMALARLQSAQGQGKEAIATLNDLIVHSPRYFEAYEQLSTLYKDSGDQANAQATLERGVAVPPQTTEDHLWRGKFLAALSRADEAEAELRLAGQDPELWEAHLRLGTLLLDAGRSPEALVEFQTVLAAQPNNETALLNAGNLLVLAGKQDEAQTLYERLTSSAPGNVDGHIALLQLLLTRGNTERAIAEGKRAVAAGDNRSDAHYFLGLAYESAADRHDASSEYALATARDPNNFQAFISLARALFKEDLYIDSINAANGAIALRADDPQPYRWKAESQLALGDVDGSLSALGTLLALKGNDPDALGLTSRAYAAKGDQESAVSYAQQATTAASNNPAGALALGDLFLATGRPDDAMKAFSSALDLGDASSQALAMVGEGRAFSLSGDTDKALKQYSGAASRDPSAAEPYLYMGHLYTEAGKWSDALVAYKKAVQLRPNWPLALYYMGRTLLQSKELQNAQAAFAKAVTSSPNMVEAWFGLGIAQRDQGHSKEAIEALTRATQLNSSYAEAWLYLGLTYEETGQRQPAADAFDHARISTSDPDLLRQAEDGLARVR